MKAFNELTPAEAERLAYLMEECGEVIQIIGKILRHGYESRDPTKATPANPSWGAPERNTSPTNRTLLMIELGDVLRGLDMLTEAGDLRSTIIEEIRAKGRPSKYLHHQGD